jgi:hypothetical protein
MKIRVCLLILINISFINYGFAGSSKSMDVKTPDGNISVNKTTVDPEPQKIVVVTGDELKGLKSLAKYGQEFVNTYLPEEMNFDLKAYDRAFETWQMRKPPKHSNEDVIKIIGGYLGNKFVTDLDMEWVTVTDEYGTDYAVRSKSVDVMSFPFSTVMKRIEKGEYDFLYGVYYTTKQMIESGEYKRRTVNTLK